MADTREKLVRAAAELFWRQGYQATGIADILEAAGVLRGSLYHFFPTKEDLLTATLEWRLRELRPDVVDPVFARIHDPIERVFGILDGYRQLLLQFDFDLGCPIGNLALELGDTHPNIRELLVANFRNWQEAVAECYRRAQLPTGTNPERLAEFTLVIMEGGLMLARTQRSIEPFDLAVTTLRDYLERLNADATNWSAPKPNARSLQRRKKP